jgi:hypothetical protein
LEGNEKERVAVRDLVRGEVQVINLQLGINSHSILHGELRYQEHGTHPPSWEMKVIVSKLGKNSLMRDD